MPFIYTVSPNKLISNLTNDQLIDLLESMGQRGKNVSPPSVIRAAFSAAARRGLITSAEADAGVQQVLRIPVVRIASGGFPA